jgi:uncharacterized C2H2 Zn-finger protein
MKMYKCPKCGGTYQYSWFLRCPKCGGTLREVFDD